MFKLNDKQRYALVGVLIVALVFQIASYASDLYGYIKLLFDETTIEVE